MRLRESVLFSEMIFLIVENHNLSLLQAVIGLNPWIFLIDKKYPGS